MRWLSRAGDGDRVPGVADIALAIGLTGYVVFDALTSGTWPEPRGVSALLGGSAAVALAWRRIYPVGSAVACLALLSSVALFVGPFRAGSSVIVALMAVWSAAAHGRRPWVTVSAVLCFAAAMGAGALWPGGVYSAAWVLIVLALPLGGGLTLRRLRRRQQDLEESSRAAEQAHEAAIAQERLRIARELHDIISHGLGFMVLQAGVADRLLKEQPEQAREALASIRRSGAEAVDELGRLLSLVRAEPEASREPQPTLADIERLASEARATGLDVLVERRGNLGAASPAVELNAYRVVQEGLTNAAKHAPGAPVRIVLTQTPTFVQVEVTHTAGSRGRPAEMRSTHLGLAGLRERVTLFGGDFDAGAEPDGGWHLRATFPIELA